MGHGRALDAGKRNAFMSLLSDTGRLRQVYRSSAEFFLINSCGSCAALLGCVTVLFHQIISAWTALSCRSPRPRGGSPQEPFPAPSLRRALGRTFVPSWGNSCCQRDCRICHGCARCRAGQGSGGTEPGAGVLSPPKLLSSSGVAVRADKLLSKPG